MGAVVSRSEWVFLKGRFWWEASVTGSRERGWWGKGSPREGDGDCECWRRSTPWNLPPPPPPSPSPGWKAKSGSAAGVAVFLVDWVNSIKPSIQSSCWQEFDYESQLKTKMYPLLWKGCLNLPVFLLLWIVVLIFYSCVWSSDWWTADAAEEPAVLLSVWVIIGIWDPRDHFSDILVPSFTWLHDSAGLLWSHQCYFIATVAPIMEKINPLQQYGHWAMSHFPQRVQDGVYHQKTVIPNTKNQWGKTRIK